jgi:hypothetical protein
VFDDVPAYPTFVRESDVPRPIAAVRTVLWIGAMLLLIAASCDGASTTSPPATPSGLDAQAGDGVVHLAWDPNGEPDLRRYNVYRGTDSGPLVALDAVPAGTQRYTDTDVTNGVTYDYAIDAENDAGKKSETTPEVSATPTAVTVVGRWDVSSWDEASWGD